MLVGDDCPAASSSFSCFSGCLSPAAAAAEILIEPRVGFHGVFQLGQPFPLEVNLENIGPPVEGILEIEVWKGGAAQGGVAYRTFHRREVFLPARSRRTVQFTIDPDLLSRPLKIQFTSSAATRLAGARLAPPLLARAGGIDR